MLLHRHNGHNRSPRRLVVVLAVGLLAAAFLAANALADPPTFNETCAPSAKILDARGCTYTVANNVNTAQAETLTVSSLVDRVHTFDGDVASGELLPSLWITPTGGATCNASGSAPGAGNTSCTLPFGSSIVSAPNSFYTFRSGDFATPGHVVTDDAALVWRGAASGPGVESDGTSTVVEQLTATTTVSIVTDASGTEHPSVTVTGEPGRPIPVGTVMVDWYSSNTCAGTPSHLGPVTLGGDGTFDATLYAEPAGGSFLAHYLGNPGDPVYAASDSACVPSSDPPAGPEYSSPADLITMIAGMSLDSRLAADLTSRAQSAADQLAHGRDGCRPLDGFVRRVGDANRRGQMTSAQAQSLLYAAREVQTNLGC